MEENRVQGYADDFWTGESGGSGRIYTREELREAEEFIRMLKQIPEQEYETGRLLLLGFMCGIEA